jgi:protein-serine/threonine kinase
VNSLAICKKNADEIFFADVLLTVNPFAQSEPIELDSLPQPLVKLTDFGLARFIDPNQPLLTTRCGSECYAAPELVLGSPYDGRQTDSWACGIVLYALAARSLPFDAKSEEKDRGSRRRYLVRIAKSEYTWPEDARLATEDLKHVVSRLLVRDPSKRAGIGDLWDEEFMRGVGAPSPPWRIAARRAVEAVDETRDEGEALEGEEDGMLVDAHDINSIASQELQ